eukprot:CAMPEP_0184869110 /NCGR_PEP_ID=MMETSP0580-20130426/32914_1 /TAXON_ID=1118495 /ORGANISM="Dactyliosolen fragilissimus" /LENGTH=156 /DNA_ID=CAMNT_0027370383 /DNA_START=575 /DNA_END=1045 /DNA_ORIENTATION=+
MTPPRGSRRNPSMESSSSSRSGVNFFSMESQARPSVRTPSFSGRTSTSISQSNPIARISTPTSSGRVGRVSSVHARSRRGHNGSNNNISHLDSFSSTSPGISISTNQSRRRSFEEMEDEERTHFQINARSLSYQQSEMDTSMEQSYEEGDDAGLYE